MALDSLTARERWRRIEAAWYGALARPPEERPAFLDAACEGDGWLRGEVESLLANETEARHFIEDPALKVAAQELAADGPGDVAGQTIGRYCLLSTLGEGGMGRVYLAEDVSLGRRVALKILPNEFSADVGRVGRFAREARAASALNHPNILTVHEVGQEGETRFIATEFIEGRTLREMLGQSRLDVKVAVDIALQVASALRASHTSWIIHRDIKPENVMVRSDGLVKVLDFGIAKLTEEGGQGTETGEGPADPIKTSPGTVLGTASYMSPEQARGEPLDGRTDLFSLGVMLYEMVAGRRPFPGGSRAAALQWLLGGHEPLTPDAKFDRAPKMLEDIIRKCLRSRREERYASAGELHDILKRLQLRLESRGQRRVVGAVVAVAVLAALAALAASLASVGAEWEARLFRDGHLAAVRQVVLSRDGGKLISVGEDGRVIAWDFSRRERMATFAAHVGTVTTTAFSPDGKWLVTAGEDRVAVVWDAARMVKVTELRAHETTIHALAFSPDGRFLVTASDSPDPRTIFWQVGTWGLARELPEPSNFGNLLISPDGRWLLFSMGPTIDLANGHKVASLFSRWGGNGAALSPDARRLVGIDSFGNVNFWGLVRPGAFHLRELLKRDRGHRLHGRAVAYSPNGHLIASGADDIILWDAVKLVNLSRFNYTSDVWSVVFSPDGRSLVSSHNDGSILQWDLPENKLIADFSGHAGSVRAVAFSPDGRRVASGGEDGSVIIWDAAGMTKEAVLLSHQTRVTGVVFSPDGEWIASVDQDSRLIRWDVARREPKWVDTGLHGSDYCLAISSDGSWLVTSYGVYESSDGRHAVNFYDGSRPGGAITGVYGAAFSADGRRLACASEYGKIYVLDTRSWQLIEEKTTGNSHFITVSFSPDGRRLATGDVEGAVRLWQIGPLAEAGEIGRHASRVMSVAFSPDGLEIASASDDKSLKLWDVGRRRLSRVVGTHTASVLSVAWSPDGKRLVSGEDDKSVRLYTRHRTLWGSRLD